jgi:hypothetical protein
MHEERMYIFYHTQKKTKKQKQNKTKQTNKKGKQTTISSNLVFRSFDIEQPDKGHCRNAPYLIM